MNPIVSKTLGPDADGNVWYRAAVPWTLADAGFAAQVEILGRKVDVQFPPGLGHGSDFVLKGLGSFAKGRNGDAHFVVRIVADPDDPTSEAGGRISGWALAIGAASVIITVLSAMFAGGLGWYLIILPIGLLVAAQVRGVRPRKRG
jgi:hypothetical protein